jgi:hypothetical protein
LQYSILPNPFMQSSYIRFYIPSAAQSARIIITDLKSTVINKFDNLKPGFGSVHVDYNHLSSGTYNY